ncbi:MAG TPA: terminase [Clostridia bacterium]|nr:terminase [Clostridia bacterium]
MKSGLFEADLDLLLRMGPHLDEAVEGEWRTAREFLAVSLLKVRDKDGQLRPLRLNRAQEEFERRRGQANIVLKARQLGMTTWVAGRFFLNTITRPGTLTVQVAHDLKSAQEIFRIVHRFLENLPEPLRQGALQTSRANVRQIVFPRLDSEYRVETAADPNAGRGLTIQNLHCSELAFWPADAADTLASLRAAVAPGGEVVIESTPKGSQGCFYREWQRAEEMAYVRHFFPWWLEPRYRLEGVEIGELREDEEELVALYGLPPEQIAFRRAKQMEFGERAREEYAEDAETCFAASGDCVFEVKMLEARASRLSAPAETRDRGRLEIYWPAVPHREYVVGVDASEGGSAGDYGCVQVIERKTGMQCAEWYGHASPEELARTAAALGREYNGAIVAVERNNHGHAVLAMLKAKERYGNLFEQDGKAGWLTTVVTRPAMLESLGATVATAPELFSSRRLMGEFRTFVRDETGRAAAAAGEHDDAIMAMAIALAVRERWVGRG